MQTRDGIIIGLARTTVVV